MDKKQLSIPQQIEAKRICLRSYRAGDGPWFYSMSQRNRSHLARYEAGNVVMSVRTENDAELLVSELASDYLNQNCFFMGVFEQETEEFVAQIYIGPVNRDIPEFTIGFFADKEHEGQGYVTEAVKAALGFIFNHLNGHRVRMECDDTNTRSRRVAEHCGLVSEGHFRENKRNPDGTLSGTMYFGLLKDEYELLSWHDRI